MSQCRMAAVAAAFLFVVSIGSTARPGIGGGTSQTRWMAVAERATILVTTAPDEKPIRLGEQQPMSGGDTLHVWDWSKSDQSRPLKASASGGFAVSPDGKLVVTQDGRLIDLASGQEKKIDGFPADVQGLCFSPSGPVVLVQIGSYTGPAGTQGAEARLLEIPSGKVRASVAGVWAYTFAAAFTPDGTQFLMMDKDRILGRFDTATGRRLARYEPAFENSIRAIAVSADAKHVAAAGTRGEMYLWDLAAGGKAIHKLAADGAPLPDMTVLSEMGSLTFSPDGTQIAGGAVMAVGIWDAATGKLARRLPSFKSGTAAVVRYSADGKKLTTVRDFVSTTGAGGKDLLVYPVVNGWELGRDAKPIGH